MSSETAVGPVFARERQRVGAPHGDEHLETLVVGEVGHHARVVRIVLDDQQDRIAGLDPVAVVAAADPPPPRRAAAAALLLSARSSAWGRRGQSA